MQTQDRGGRGLGERSFLRPKGQKGIPKTKEAPFYHLSEEHGHADCSQCARKPEIGERVTVIPNHCCAVTKLFNQVVGVCGSMVEVVWPVACRGAVQ